MAKLQKLAEIILLIFRLLHRHSLCSFNHYFKILHSKNIIKPYVSYFNDHIDYYSKIDYGMIKPLK